MKKSLIKAINGISTNAEMNEVIDLIKIKQKQLRAVKAFDIKQSISVGSDVIVNSRNGSEKGVVTKIKRTKAVVEINGRLWNCPLTILQVA
jgi:hypothetical protein|tara:strand:- start:7597 stop:7869 length:273 start_codon:yes stop_codon:yes gene_type:complete